MNNNTNIRLSSRNGRYPRYRNEHGVGVAGQTCGCETLFSPDGRCVTYLCRGHGGDSWSGTHTHDLSTWPTFDEAALATRTESDVPGR